MKLTYKDLFAVQDMLGKVWELPLIPKIFIRLRRFSKSIENELKTFDPERVKLFQRHPEFIKDGKFSPPEPKDEGFVEFMKDYDSVFGETVDIPYENIDATEVEKDIENGKEKIVGTDGNLILNFLEMLNKANDEQKIEPVSASAE
jgi:hypothetical protein